MAINIKSPAGDVLGNKGGGKPSGGGEFDGEPGYAKRTSTPNGPKERTYDAIKPSTNVSIKSPGNSVKK